jgi:hypothetical protein
VCNHCSEPVIDGPYGGKGGTFWSDEIAKSSGPIAAMKIASGSIIDSITVSIHCELSLYSVTYGTSTLYTILFCLGLFLIRSDMALSGPCNMAAIQGQSSTLAHQTLQKKKAPIQLNH